MNTELSAIVPFFDEELVMDDDQPVARATLTMQEKPKGAEWVPGEIFQPGLRKNVLWYLDKMEWC